MTPRRSVSRPTTRRPSAAELGIMSGAPPFGRGQAVTLGNWELPPFNRWSFQHVRELIPTAPITRSPTPRRLPAQTLDVAALSCGTGARPLTVADVLQETWTDGFLVLHRGRVVTEQYWNGLTPASTHLLMSVSKSIVSTVAGCLAGEGLLDAAQPVESIVPELGGTSWRGATVQHLLDMRTGTKFDETYERPDADVQLLEEVFGWRPRRHRDLPPDGRSYFATLHNDGAHGGPFRYRSVLTDVLGWVLEQATGKRLADLVSETVWGPMGAEHDAEVTVDSSGYALADGGICASLRDVGRFGLLVLETTLGRGRTALPRAWMEDTIEGAPDGATAFVAAERRPGFPPGAHYRNCWWVRDRSVPFFNASGVNGQSIFVHVPSATVVVKFSTWPQSLSPRYTTLTISAVKAIVEELTGRPAW